MAGTSDSASGENASGDAPDPGPSDSTSDTASGASTGAATAEPEKSTTEEPAKAEKPAKAEQPAKAEKPTRAEKKAEKPAKESKGAKAGAATAAAIKAAPGAIRTRVAQLVWVLCLIAALFLALAALVVALDFNQSNAAVEFVLNGADKVDLGVFTPEGGIKQFKGDNAATKNALVNYGVGAVFWIVVGRVADRFIRP